MKNLTLFTSLLIVASFIFACEGKQESKKTIVIEEKTAYVNSPLDSLFKKLRPPIQKFTIVANKPNILTLKKGTKIIIPANSFIDNKGEYVTDVTMEVIEANEQSDYILGNLNSLSNGQPLASGGMFFISATSNGTPLALHENSRLYLNVETNADMVNKKIYEGNYVGSKINWISSKVQNDFYIIPAELIYPDDWLMHVDKVYFSLGKRNNGTIVSTMEIRNRLRLTDDLGMYLIAKDNIEWDQEYDTTVYNIYTSNPDKNLYQMDSMVVDFLQGVLEKEGDKLTYSRWLIYFIEAFKNLEGQKLTKPIDFDTYGIDFEKETALQDLQNKHNLDISLASRLVSLYSQRKSLIEELTKHRQGQLDRLNTRLTYTYAISALGWNNIDKLFYEKNAIETDPVIHPYIVGIKNLDYVYVSLNFKQNGILLPGNKVGEKYKFTDGFTKKVKVPYYENGYYIALTYKNGQAYFGSMPANFSKTEIIELELLPVSDEQLKEKINQLSKN